MADENFTKADPAKRLGNGPTHGRVVSERRTVELDDFSRKRRFGARRVHRLESARDPRRRLTETSSGRVEGVRRLLSVQISGGMQKRAGLARAMAMDPEILFFDEPSAGLDPISSRLLDDLILELRDSLGATVVVVTHELASIFHHRQQQRIPRH